MAAKVGSGKFSPTALVLLATVLPALVSPDVSAEEKCFAGNEESGTLTFSGAVEGSGFSGRFDSFSVGYCMAPGAPSEGVIDVRVELASADTDNRERDETLKGEAFFAVDQYPEAAWKSRSVSDKDSGYVADGELELKGISAAQSVNFTLTPDGEDLLARGEFSMRGDAEVDRQRFGVGTGEFADPEFVRNRVDVIFQIRLIAKD